MSPNSLGAYNILDKLGVGPSASVFQATNSTTKKYVALKVFDGAAVSDRETIRALNRAVVISSNLHCDNIVKVYDIDKDEGSNVHYIAMEYVDGVALKFLLEHYKKFEPQQACQIVQDISKGLSYAHRSGICHGNLIPENVIVEKQTGRVVITDFGVSRVLMQANSKLAADPTRVGFRAPELADGATPDARSDVFSLGALLYYLLTGEYPARGMVSVPGPALPQMPRLRSLLPNLPIWLETIVARCMVADPLERVASTADIFEEIEVGLDSEEEGRAHPAADDLDRRPQENRYSSQQQPTAPPANHANQENLKLLRSKTAGGPLGMLMRGRRVPTQSEASVEEAERRLLGLDYDNKTNRTSRRSQRGKSAASMSEKIVSPSINANLQQGAAGGAKISSINRASEREARPQRNEPEPASGDVQLHGSRGMRTSRRINEQDSSRPRENVAPGTDPRMAPQPNDPRMGPQPNDPRMGPQPGEPRPDPRMAQQPSDPRMGPQPNDPRMGPQPGGPRPDPRMAPQPNDPRMGPQPGGPRPDPRMAPQPNDPRMGPQPGGPRPDPRMAPQPNDPRMGPQPGGPRPDPRMAPRGESNPRDLQAGLDKAEASRREADARARSVLEQQSQKSQGPSSREQGFTQRPGFSSGRPTSGPESSSRPSIPTRTGASTMSPGTVRVSARPADSGSKKGGKILGILFAILIVLLGGGAAAWFFLLPKGLLNISINAPHANVKAVADGKVVASATITDGAGQMKVPLAKAITLSVSADGYVDKEVSVKPIETAEQPGQVAVALEGNPGKLSVVITNSRLPNPATVTVWRGDKQLAKQVTKNGAASAMENIPTGVELVVKAEAPGFVETEEKVTIDPNEGQKAMSLELKRDRGTLRIALVGQDVDRSIVTIKVLEGKKELYSKKQPKGTASVQIEVPLNKQLAVKVSSNLHAPASGSAKLDLSAPDSTVEVNLVSLPELIVTSKPNAGVYISNSKVGTTDGQGSLSVRSSLLVAGKPVTITVAKDGFLDGSKKITPTPGANTVNINLSPAPVYEAPAPAPAPANSGYQAPAPYYQPAPAPAPYYPPAPPPAPSTGGGGGGWGTGLGGDG